MLKAYKARNQYDETERVQPTKIAAFLALLVARDCPVRTLSSLGQSVNSVEVAILNAHLAWRLIQSLLQIRKIADEHVEYLIRCLHNVDRNAATSDRFIEDWGVMLMEAICDAWGSRLSLQQDLG